MTNVVIVESAAKGSTIQKYLKDLESSYGKFVVIASNGHISDIAKKTTDPQFVYGIDTNRWIGKYEVIPEKQKHVKLMKSYIDKAKVVYLAADKDREGESIAWQIQQLFQIDNYKRITFNEITKSAIQNAVRNPTGIDLKMVNSQQARRFLDRIVGFSLTKQLWKNFDSFANISAGRVQSVLLYILVEFEKQVIQFKSESYYTVQGCFNLQNFQIEDAKLYDNNTGRIKHFDGKNQSLTLTKYLNTIKDASFTIDLSNTKIIQRKEKPPSAFITSTLQQEASSKLGFSAKKTMIIAQKLYESGRITYMRTDSTKLSDEAMKSIQLYISNRFGVEHFEHRNKSEKKSKNAQEAHEAIRPSKFSFDSTRLDSDPKKLYDLILNRTIGSQMNHCVYEELCIHIKDNIIENKCCFVGKLKSTISPGYKLLYDVKPEKSLNNVLASIQKNSISSKVEPISINATQVWSTPPARFNESKVIKKLESNGIGRPSTYSSIIEKLFDRQFIIKKDVKYESKIYKDYIIDFIKKKTTQKTHERPYYEERSVIQPTTNGIKVNDFLQKYFSNIINVDFTSSMEDNLDNIAKGKSEMANIMQVFYKSFQKEIEKIPKDSKSQLDKYSKSIKINKIDFTIRSAKYGPVIEYQKKNESGEVKKFISLTAYMKDTNKNIEDVTEKDVRFLVNLPKEITKDVTLNYGRYGLYYKHNNGKNLRVFKNKIEDVIENSDHTYYVKKLSEK